MAKILAVISGWTVCVLCGLALAANEEHSGHGQAVSQPESASTPMASHHHVVPEVSAASALRDPDAYADGFTRSHMALGEGDTMRALMNGESHFFALDLQRLEAARARGETATAYAVRAWWGGDYHRIAVNSEGDLAGDTSTIESKTDVLWARAYSAFWDSQWGLRVDTGLASRMAVVAGMHGLAPYWFDVDAKVALDNVGRLALDVEVEYEALLTQRLILQPRATFLLGTRDDAARDVGAGFSEASVGLRLRYEIVRRFAPYVGVEWTGKFARTADLARAQGRDVRDYRWLAGLRAWY